MPMPELLQPVLTKNDRMARLLIILFSIVVFVAVSSLTRVQLHVNLGFDVHVFALANAVINSIIAVLLIAAIIAVKTNHYLLHKRIMLTALILSVIFLISYVAHHLLAGEAIYGDANHDAVLSTDEKEAVAGTRGFYLVILLSHIFLAAIILPFILFTAYRALIAEFPRHKKLARITWPLWLYVAISGPIVYWMIHPYYR
jgi:putative membrane protein